MSSLSKKGLKLKTPLRTPSHPDPCIPQLFKEKNTGISYWSRGGQLLLGVTKFLGRGRVEARGLYRRRVTKSLSLSNFLWNFPEFSTSFQS